MKGGKNMVALSKNVDRSFNMGKQLNDSFESVQPAVRLPPDGNMPPNAGKAKGRQKKGEGEDG